MEREIELITATELLKRLNITRPTLDNWRKMGLPTTPIGPKAHPKYNWQSVKKWLEGLEKQGQGTGGI